MKIMLAENRPAWTGEQQKLLPSYAVFTGNAPATCRALLTPTPDFLIIKRLAPQSKSGSLDDD
jgi:hypothetical protein